jgi:hypothetical protein
MSHAKMLMAALVAGCVWLASPVRAADPQQTQPPAPSAPSGRAASSVSWLTGYRFHLDAASVRSDDPRFHWDAHFGGDVDLLDYRVGRVTLLADYEVMIGSKLRTVDPNQGAYHLALSTSARSGPAEARAFFDHVSRHLSDRANRTAVSWNSAGVLATTRTRRGATAATFDVRAAQLAAFRLPLHQSLTAAIGRRQAPPHWLVAGLKGPCYSLLSPSSATPHRLRAAKPCMP